MKLLFLDEKSKLFDEIHDASGIHHESKPFYPLFKKVIKHFIIILFNSFTLLKPKKDFSSNIFNKKIDEILLKT